MKSADDLLLINPTLGSYKIIVGGRTTNDPSLYLDGSFKAHYYPEGFSALGPHHIGAEKDLYGPGILHRMISFGISRAGGGILSEFDSFLLTSSREVQASRINKEREN